MNLMKQTLFTSVMALLFATGVYSQDGVHFRQATWGMTKKEVKQVERMEGHSLWNLLVYTSEVEGIETTIQYIFDEERLVKGQYQFSDETLSDYGYYKAYKDLKDALEKKYDEPAETSATWTDDTYKNDMHVISPSL